MVSQLNPDELYFTNGVKTFEHQDDLPSLPLPDLNDALQKYLDSVRVLVNDEEFSRTKLIVEDFKTGVGRKLYEQLLQKSRAERNWMSEWWDQVAYLSTRSPCAPLINITGPDRTLTKYWKPESGTQLERCAFVLYYVTVFWNNLRRERLRVDCNKKGDKLCMNQYRRFLNSCRIPGSEVDRMVFHFKSAKDSAFPIHGHVAIICQGRIFSLPLIDSNGTILAPPEIEKHLHAIVKLCKEKGHGPGIGALTSDDRTSWAEFRRRLIDLHPDNLDSLEMIERSIIIVVLDDSSPPTSNELCYIGLAGEPKNRWFDKPLSVIITENGCITTNCDHTSGEGIVLLNLFHYCDLWLAWHHGKWKGSYESHSIPSPQELVFHIDDKIRDRISICRERFSKTAQSVEIILKDFTGYGARYLRDWNIHADSHMQLAIQYTYYRLYGRPACTYETATTRRFYHGRTETVRSCTKESVTFAQSMCSHACRFSDRHQLYRKSLDNQLWLMRECQNGQGCDRLLLGLYLQSLESGVPLHDFFTDSSQIKSGSGGNFILSTSFLGFYSLIGGCPPMVKDGYGIFYCMQDNCITMYVTAFRCRETSAEQFAAELCQSLADMSDLVSVKVPSKHQAKL